MPNRRQLEFELRRFPYPFRNVVTANTASKTLTQSQTGSVQTNLGATGAVTLTLPQQVQKGQFYDFAVAAAQDLRIEPGAAGALYINGAKQTDNKYAESAYIGDTMRATADGNDDWICSIAPPLEVSGLYDASSVDLRFFTANRPYRIIGAYKTTTVQASDAGAVTAMIRNVSSGTAIASGLTVITATFNLKLTTDTAIVGTLSATDANLDLVAGDSLALDFTGTMTAATGVITVLLSPWKVVT